MVAKIAEQTHGWVRVRLKDCKLRSSTDVDAGVSKTNLRTKAGIETGGLTKLVGNMGDRLGCVEGYWGDTRWR